MENIPQTAWFDDQDLHLRPFLLTQTGSGSSAKPGSKLFRQLSCSQNLFLGRGNIIRNTVAADGHQRRIVDHKTGAGIPVARLADAADVEEVFVARLDLNLHADRLIEKFKNQQEIKK